MDFSVDRANKIVLKRLVGQFDIAIEDICDPGVSQLLEEYKKQIEELVEEGDEA